MFKLPDSCEQAQQLENLVMEAEQEDFNKSVENLTKHCNAYVSSDLCLTGVYVTTYFLCVVDVGSKSNNNGLVLATGL